MQTKKSTSAKGRKPVPASKKKAVTPDAKKRRNNTGTEKVSAAKENTAKESAVNKDTARRKELASSVGFFITSLVTLLLVFLIIFKDMAFFGKVMRPVICGLVGESGLILLPLYLIAILVSWFKDRRDDKVGIKWLFAAINYVMLLMLIHCFTCGNEDQPLGTAMWNLGKEGSGTGFIGGNLYMALQRFMGKAPSVTLLVIAFIATLPMLFNTTPLRLIRKIAKNLRTMTVQVADSSVDDEEEELTAYVPEEEPHTGRCGAELRKPKSKSEGSGKKKTKERELFIYDDSLDEPQESSSDKDAEQTEINRTRGRNEDSDSYKEIFAEDTVPAADNTAETGGQTPLTVVSEAVSGAETEKADTLSESEAVSAGAGNPEAADKGSGTGEKGAMDVKSEPVEEEAPPYVFPPISLLKPQSSDEEGFSPEEIQHTGDVLVETLSNFGVEANIVSTSCGPTITRYALQPGPKVRVKTIANLSDDIALHLAATSIRIAPIPGKSAIGVEIPNKNKNIVRLRKLIEDKAFRESDNKLLCCLGADVVGKSVFLDVEKMPHLLIAGATGMGKSVCINSLIISLLYRARPDEVKLILVDPKKVEFTDYNGIPHLLIPVVTEPKKAAGSLNWAVMEMERRFSEIQEVGARNLKEYNEIIAGNPEKEYIPQVVIVIDELADLMMTAPAEVENSICRLAQKARAAGMHLIIGTQRPSVDVITGLIKANIPSRIACKTASQVDSRTILDMAGAEKLLGKGDMLYNPVGVLKPIRVQGAFVSSSEVIKVCTYLKQAAEAKYSEDVMAIIEAEAQLCGEKPSKRQGADSSDDSADPLELDAIEIALECDTLSTSLLQRRLSIGFQRAGRIIDKLEQKGIIGPFDASSKKRKVLITKDEFLQMKLNSADASNTEESSSGGM